MEGGNAAVITKRGYSLRRPPPYRIACKAAPPPRSPILRQRRRDCNANARGNAAVVTARGDRRRIARKAATPQLLQNVVTVRGDRRHIASGGNAAVTTTHAWWLNQLQVPAVKQTVGVPPAYAAAEPHV